MNDLQELGAMRADVTGRRPEDLHRARDLLIAEISAAGQDGPARRAARARRLDRIARGIRLADRHGRIWPRATLAGATAVAAAPALTAAAGRHPSMAAEWSGTSCPHARAAPRSWAPTST